MPKFSRGDIVRPIVRHCPISPANARGSDVRYDIQAGASLEVINHYRSFLYFRGYSRKYEAAFFELDPSRPPAK
ncbi:MAG TPA: hypothetical protein VJI33_02200 [Candidatus Paceibacterota bacterium]